MLKRATLSVLALTAFVGSTVGAVAQDKTGWVDEGARPVYRAIPSAEAQADMPPVAPDVHRSPAAAGRHLAQGGFLTGSATATGAAVRTQLPQMPMYAPLQGNAAEVGLGGNVNTFNLNARQTNETVPPEAMRGWLEKTHPEFTLSVQNDPMQIVEVKGAWDDAGQILNNMQIRHQRIKARELKDVLSNNTKVLIINCEGKIPEDEFEAVRQWVIRGGYLISTDWTLHSFIERAFPGTIAYSGSNTRGEVVDGQVVGHDPALLAGTNVASAGWKLDDQSQEVRIIRPDIVQVLVRSNRLASQERHLQFTDPTTAGVLACTFPYGRGRVLHLVGHFDYNSGFGFNRFLLPDAIPGRGVGLRQAIATNFLVQGVERRGR